MLGKLQKYNKRCVPILYKHRILAAEKTLIWKQEGYAQCPEMKMSLLSRGFLGSWKERERLN